MSPDDSSQLCPCQSGLPYGQCCGRLHGTASLNDADQHLGAVAPTAVALMRSRYCAFVVGNGPYLLATWHPSTRPATLDLNVAIEWLGLEIVAIERGGPLDRVGYVEFVAYFSGGFQRERSEFVRENGRWFYVTSE